jgi:hypothetical protein
MGYHKKGEEKGEEKRERKKERRKKEESIISPIYANFLSLL